METNKALGILLAVIVAIGTYLTLAMWLGVHEYWAGFLFLLQWSMMEEMKVNHIPKSAIGATGGTALAFLPAWLSPLIGLTGATVVMLSLIVIATFALIKGRASIVANAAMMVFLTVVTIPHIVQAATAMDIFIGIGAGVGFFGGLALLASVVTKAKQQRMAKPVRQSS